MGSRIEPEKFNSFVIHEKCLEIFEKKQWVPFFDKFDGCNEKASWEFAHSFDGERATIGNFTFRLSKDILAQIIVLPQQGERFFKTKQFEEKAWVPFLCRSRAGSMKWKKGVPRSSLIHPWDEVAYIFQKFLTCEGRFSIIYLYHIKLMQHLNGDCEINIPYFLLQSLSKMAKVVHKRTRDTTPILFHCGLIKISLTQEFQKQSLIWQ